jgi:hypothetical protein
MEPPDAKHVSLSEVHRLIGAIVAEATALELQLADAVTSLSRSPLTSLVVQGERGRALVGMARRLLRRGIGSTDRDERSGATERHGLISADDTKTFEEALKRAERFLDRRDEVVHSLWLANLESDRIHAQRKTRSKQQVRTWTLEEMNRLRQDLANVATDIFICSFNTDGSGMQRMDPRQGDVF